MHITESTFGSIKLVAAASKIGKNTAEICNVKLLNNSAKAGEIVIYKCNTVKISFKSFGRGPDCVLVAVKQISLESGPILFAISSE